MKRKLLLYLSRFEFPGNTTIASTLAWLAKSKGSLFDNYYDSYHQGIHFPGGDSRDLVTGQLTGGTVCGDRHFEEFYFLLHNFDVSIIASEKTIFFPAIRNFDIPIVSLSDRMTLLYKEAFRFFDAPLPKNIVMVGSRYKKNLSGLEAYLYPEIYHRQAIGVVDSIPDEDLALLHQEGGKIYCFYVDKNVISNLRAKGYDLEVVDQLEESDDYSSVTKRIATRWSASARGWILGDPALVAHWLPTACDEGLVSIYGIPQEKIVSQLADLIGSKGRVVYGRQYSDRDFFELSKLNQCLQVIDPCRPPFQSAKHTEYDWCLNEESKGFYENEYSDDVLRQFAAEGRILISLMFWSGMIREVENFHNLLDLVAMTMLRCGVVITAQSYEYMMHSPFELLTMPVNQGGVYPLVEPVLGSCGIGVGIESCMTNERLEENLKNGMSGILAKIRNQRYMPRGWWATMDTDLEKCSWGKKPKPIRLLRHSPYVQFRFHLNDKMPDEDSNPDAGRSSPSIRERVVEGLKTYIKEAGLMKYFEPYRPYEFYQAGPMKKEIVEAVKSAGLQYMFTKSGFHSSPEIKYRDDDFIALNYTAGQWDGWTPFETVNDVSDLKTAEKVLLRRNKPGWIVSTIDSCLWTFSGEFWRRGNRLYDIARFCADGGRSGKLINAKPFTIARYARILSENQG